MSSKIEVSRELAENLLALATTHNTSDWSSELCGALHTLLAAHVVERQPVVTILQPDPYDERGGAWMSSQDLRRLEALPVGTKLYAAPPELAELQATIAQRDALMNRAVQAWAAAETINDMDSAMAALRDALSVSSEAQS